MQHKRNESSWTQFLPKIMVALTIITSIPIFTSLGWAGEDAVLYNHARHFAKTGKTDFAYMNFNELITNFPRSAHRREALLAVAEYYFDAGQYTKSETLFNDLLTDDTQPKIKLFIMAYLLKIAEVKQNKNLLKELEKKIINFQQVSLIFRNHKDFTYLSPMNTNFNAVYQINTIEFYRQGVLFAKISY